MGLVANHQPAIERLQQQQHESAGLHTHTKRPGASSESSDQDRAHAHQDPSESKQAPRDPRKLSYPLADMFSHAVKQQQQQQGQTQAGQQPPKPEATTQPRRQQGRSKRQDSRYQLPPRLLSAGKKTWRRGYNSREMIADPPTYMYEVDLRFGVSPSLLAVMHSIFGMRCKCRPAA